jgi:hypothetical protein
MGGANASVSESGPRIRSLVLTVGIDRPAARRASWEYLAPHLVHSHSFIVTSEVLVAAPVGAKAHFASE